MSKILMECNVPSEELPEIFAQFDGYLTNEEEEAFSGKFKQYLFYETYGRRDFRECVCTTCGVFEVNKDEVPGFFQAHHGDGIECPSCGTNVTVYSLGRMRTGSSLKEWKRAAFIRKAEDGGILISAGYATKDYTPYDLRPCIDWNEKSRTYLAPGRRMQWTKELRSYWNCLYAESGKGWERSKQTKEPFNPAMYMHDGSYYLFGWDKLMDSSLKYCQLEDWYRAIGQEWLSEESEPVRQVYKYLARYTAYPQMEMAVKLGLSRAVEELVVDGVKNHKYLNWNAKKVQDFLRMSKQDANAFLEVGGDIRQLRHCKDAMKTGVFRSVSEYLDCVAELNGMDNLTKAAECAQIAGCNIKQAAKYVQSQMPECYRAGVSVSTILQYWKDYLDMARQLDYGLAEQTVAMPKDLKERHDTAATMIRVQQSAEERKKYQRRYKQLKKLYEFSYGDLSIIVPPDGQSITMEGKTLHHCVGGYADRHLAGKVDILFLRHTRKPMRSFLTIEMIPRKSVRDKVQMMQVHGYKNERYTHAVSARVKYDWFLSIWMQWLKAGSKRDKDGKPIIPENRKEQTA